MFCPNCGSNISNDSTFCPNCGTKIEQKINSKDNSDSSKDFFKTICKCIKNPLTEISNLKETLSDNNNYIYLGIITLIISIMFTISLKLFNSSITISIPFYEIFLSYIINLVIFYGIILFLVFAIYKFIFKEEIKLQDFLRVLLSALIVRGTFVLIQTIISIISFKFSIIIFIVGLMTSILVLYSGFKEIVKNYNKLLYTFSIAYLVSTFFEIYIISKISMLNIIILFIESIFY